MKEVLILFGIIPLTVIGGLVSLVIWAKVMSCNERWKDTRDHEWRWFAGCMVESNGKFVPEDRVWFEQERRQE